MEVVLVDLGAGLIVTSALGMLIALRKLLSYRGERVPLVLGVAEEETEVVVEGCCVVKLPS